MAAEMASTLKKLDDDGHKFALLIRELHALGLMLETERLKFKDVATFQSRQDVKQLVARLRAPFANDITRHETEVA